MSYCRFSSNNGKSDVYCWRSVQGGWCIMVAECRIVGRMPKDLCKVKTKKIGLPHDGQDFNCRTRKVTVKRLQGLRELGYRVPQHAIDRLNEEIQTRRR